MTDGVFRVPKPDWSFDFNEETNTAVWKPYFDEFRTKFWEIEERILTTAVVDLLRSKGYTVIEPGGDLDD